MSKETWTYTQDNPDNPNKGEVRSNSGGLICVRAVMNPDDERVMRWIAAAPELLVALEAVVERYAPTWSPANNAIDAMWRDARAAIALARGEKP